MHLGAFTSWQSALETRPVNASRGSRTRVFYRPFDAPKGLARVCTQEFRASGPRVIAREIRFVAAPPSSVTRRLPVLFRETREAERRAFTRDRVFEESEM